MSTGTEQGRKPQTWAELLEASGDRKSPLVIAHRGTPRQAPENTLASFSNALEQGADVLETDLRITQDGAIVLIHDGTLDRTTDGTGLVASHSLSEIKRFRTYAPWGEYVDEEVPTLLELLWVTQAKVPLLLELKDPLFADEVWARRLVWILQTHDMLERCAVVSFKTDLVESVTRVSPDLPSGLITLTRPWPKRNTSLLGPFWPLLIANPLYVRWAHRMDGIVAPLDTSPEKRMWYYLWLGVDAVLSDRPAAANDAIRRAG
jgi:glycerophosphoryl diester phosphodiesterase